MLSMTPSAMWCPYIMRNFDTSKGLKRGPKGPRNNYEPALQAMVPLVRRGISVLAAAQEVAAQHLCRILSNETATAHRLRTLFAQNRERLMPPVTLPYTVADLAWHEALHRAIIRSP